MNPSKPPLDIDGQHNAPHAFMDLLTLTAITYHAIADCDERGFKDFFDNFYVSDDGLHPKAGFTHARKDSAKERRR